MAGGSRPCTAVARLGGMEDRASWIARAWLPYFLAGVAWLMVGAFVLREPRGLGMTFIGLSCLSLGIYGAGWRLAHGYGLARKLSGQSRRD